MPLGGSKKPTGSRSVEGGQKVRTRHDPKPISKATFKERITTQRMFDAAQSKDSGSFTEFKKQRSRRERARTREHRERISRKLGL